MDSAANRDVAVPGLGALASAGIQSVRQLATDFLDLVAMESRLAGLALAVTAGLGAAAALLLTTAWLLLIAAGVRALVAATGLSLDVALLLVAGINVIIAGTLIALIPRIARHLAFNATRRMLRTENARETV